MKVRFAKEEDVPVILNIYKEYIDTPITFEYSLPNIDKFSEDFKAIKDQYPYLVCEENGIICGYAYAHQFKEREAYKWGVELSIYMSKNVQSKGFGTTMYETLISILKLQGYRTVYGCITLPNEKSESLHKKLGFSEVGVFHKSGFKNNAWYDVVWYERIIGDMQNIPETPIAINKMADEVEKLLIN